MDLKDRYGILKNYDLSGLTKNQARKFSFLIENLLVQGVKSAFYGSVINELERDKTSTSKYFGIPIWDNIILNSEDKNKNKRLRIDMVLLDVSMTKNIIKTSIQGLNGTIKEYISDGDYAINIQGAIFSENNTYPEDDVLTLIEICKKQENIRVESGFLNRIDIDNIVIERYRLGAKKATMNAQFFDISAVSDTPQELIFRG